MEPTNENPFKTIAEVLNELSARLFRAHERVDELGATVAALNVEQGVHGRRILGIYRHLDELSAALRNGTEPPAPPKPEQARLEAQEIAELDNMLRDEPPPEAA